jgi:anti-anti-sigma factor
MPMDEQGKVLYANHKGVHVLRFVGDIRYPLSPSLDRFLQGLFQEAKPAGFVLDLTQTEGLDSTNLGIMARIAKHMRRCGGPRVTVVSEREDINELLLSMGFDKVFDIVDSAGRPSVAGEPVPTSELTREELSRTILEAHRALIALNERNHALFRDVVALLEQEHRAED